MAPERSTPRLRTGDAGHEFFTPRGLNPADTLTLEMAIIPFGSGETLVGLDELGGPTFVDIVFSEELVNGLPYDLARARGVPRHRSAGLARCSAPPSQAQGKAVSTSMIGHQLGPRSAMVIAATAPAALSTSPTTPRAVA